MAILWQDNCFMFWCMWKNINGFNDYQISDDGRVRSFKRGIRILKPGNVGKGYLTVCLRKDSQTFRFYVHRLVADAFIPNSLHYPIVNHIDGNKHNNSVNNLEWVSYAHNNRHAYDCGLKPRGEGFYNAKLTYEDVAEIRQTGKQTTYQNIANQYNVSKATIRDVLLNRTWKGI